MDNRIFIIGLLFILLIIICFLLVTIELFDNHNTTMSSNNNTSTLLSKKVEIEETLPQTHSKHEVIGNDGLTYYTDMGNFIEKRSSQLVPI